MEPTDEAPTEEVPAQPVAPEAEPEVPEKAKKKKTGWVVVGEWVAVIVLALGAALLLRTFVVQTFYIPSASMTPTLQIDDRVIVDKLSYRFHDPHRKDLVVFTTPNNVSKQFKDLVKRVIGLPRDRVEAHDGHVYVNGQQLDEPYLEKGTTTKDFGPITVPPGQYWVMGDNRGFSEDSRFFGPIHGSTIVGRAFIRIWPLSRFGLL
jgi:signal peptidase I